MLFRSAGGAASRSYATESADVLLEATPGEGKCRQFLGFCGLVWSCYRMSADTPEAFKMAQAALTPRTPRLISGWRAAREPGLFWSSRGALLCDEHPAERPESVSVGEIVRCSRPVAARRNFEGVARSAISNGGSSCRQKVRSSSSIRSLEPQRNDIKQTVWVAVLRALRRCVLTSADVNIPRVGGIMTYGRQSR